MIEKDLLELLACPETHQPLREAAPVLLERLNARIVRAELRNRAGTLVATPLREGLVRADERVLYPVVDGIPMLLIEEAIAIP
jgi:uncharacterized protein YbaR (Trm112 family)